MAVSKKRKKIILIVLIILIALFFGVYMLRKHSEQIQGLIKNKVSYDVINKEKELNDIIAEMRNPEFPKEINHWFVSLTRDEDILSYTELDNDKITNIYNEFSLWYISNHMDNSECNYAAFAIFHHPACLVWGDYRYGFYYSEEDKPIDIYGHTTTDSNTKIYVDCIDFEYWYRTEKITDNWWFFEAQITFKFPEVV